ncbi:hypothetical protein BU23DRAFT_113080 [Bimuria novae-zelandiae CBS 107.79]|uniref:Uncharacterized protein n=1 Tax=Bimuria novae-zelandiae CBS 107.79 TaxID=1447943 RepID=A0A6A5VE76_9PLEO|nr:hypothetical protein BU23DRAFT_113080 [Bimuria novae-zelandiae CBS 107.79]
MRSRVRKYQICLRPALLLTVSSQVIIRTRTSTSAVVSTTPATIGQLEVPLPSGSCLPRTEFDSSHHLLVKSTTVAFVVLSAAQSISQPP